MILGSIHDLAAKLEGKQRLLGLDVGSKTIGLALSNSALTLASPLETIRRAKFASDAARLGDLIVKHDVGGLVIGLPVEMNGNEGPACQSIRQFAANLLERLEIDIAFWDERLSTAAVERFLVDQADMTRRRRAEVVDKMAAAYILQGALDAVAVGQR